MMPTDVLPLVRARRGHFVLESGHHGELWLELEALCLQPTRIRPLTADLATRLARYEIDMVCGPFAEGALVGLMVALELEAQFVYTAYVDDAHSGPTLFPVTYRLPTPLRPAVKGKRIAIVNDVINAGSAVRGTFTELQAAEADVVVVAALALLGDSFSPFATEHHLPIETLAHVPNDIWTPTACPLCAMGASIDSTESTPASS